VATGTGHLLLTGVAGFSGTVDNVYVSDITRTWTQQTGSGTANWRPMASSADGTRLAAGAYGGYIYTSTDSGVTWTQQTNPGSRNWISIASSADGTKLAAAVITSGYVYTSTDSEAAWTQRNPAGGTADWRGVASSADGTKLVAVAYGGYVYTSTDSGATWTQQTGSGSRNWISVASSADGTKLAAAVAVSGYIYTSTDSGATWTQQTASGLRDWFSIASSADGTKLVAGVNNLGYIYTSTDSGATWTQQTGSGTRYWQYLASSADGTKLAAVDVKTGDINGGYVYTSDDSGVTWIKRMDAGQAFWRGIASSTDGSKLAVGAYNTDYLYTSDGSPKGTVLATGLSNQFSIGGEDDMYFTFTDPDNSAYGIPDSGPSVAFSPQPAVVLKAKDGTTVTTETGTVTLSVNSASVSGYTFSGTKTAQIENGVATYSGLYIDKPGAYTLKASATINGKEVTGISNSFNIYQYKVAGTVTYNNVGTFTVVGWLQRGNDGSTVDLSGDSATVSIYKSDGTSYETNCGGGNCNAVSMTENASVDNFTYSGWTPTDQNDTYLVDIAITYNTQSFTGRFSYEPSAAQLADIKSQTDTINWTNITDIKSQTDTINWTDITDIKSQTDTINWTDIGVLKSNVSAIKTVTDKLAPVNWDDITVMTEAGINWDDLTVLSESGINWDDLMRMSTSAINWNTIDAEGANWATLFGRMDSVDSQLSTIDGIVTAIKTETDN